jgi:hypothetical protein
MTNDQDKALYIKHNGREWVVWLNNLDELIAIPGDEEDYSHGDLAALQQYLYEEGFFEEHYQRRLEGQEDF